jgi:hypothetical protein
MIEAVIHHPAAFHFWTWLGHMTGVSDEAGPGYGFWSGIGSDIGQVTLIGGMLAFWHQHSCHDHRCLRLAVHPVEGTPYKTCRKHHPVLSTHKRITAELIRLHHKAAQES